MSRRQKPSGQSIRSIGRVGAAAAPRRLSAPRAVTFKHAAAVGEDAAILARGAGMEDLNVGIARGARGP